MVVVQDQHSLAVAGLDGQLIDQRCQQAGERRRRGRAEQRAHPLADSWSYPVQRGHGVTPEPGRVVVALIQRQPCHWPLAVPDPIGQQDRLAVSGGAQSSTSPRFSHPSRHPVSRGRDTTPAPELGTCSLVASSTSRSDATSARAAGDDSAIVDGCSSAGSSANHSSPCPRRQGSGSASVAGGRAGAELEALGMTIPRAREALARLCVAGARGGPGRPGTDGELLGADDVAVAWICWQRLERPAGWAVPLADTDLVHVGFPCEVVAGAQSGPCALRAPMLGCGWRYWYRRATAAARRTSAT